MTEANDLRQKIQAIPMLPAERATALQNLAAAEAIVDTVLVIASWLRRCAGVLHKPAPKSAFGAR